MQTASLASITAPLLAMTTATKAIITVATVVVIIVPFMLHRPLVALPKIQNTQMMAQPSSSEANVAKDETGAEERHYRPAPVTCQVRQAVDGFTTSRR